MYIEDTSFVLGASMAWYSIIILSLFKMLIFCS